MKKLAALRAALLAAPLKLKADKLLTFAEKGKVQSWRGGDGDNRAFQILYTAHVIITDYAGAPQDLFFVALDWLHANCPDLDPEEAVRFHVDIIDHKSADVSLALDLSEIIAARARPAGRTGAGARGRSRRQRRRPRRPVARPVVTSDPGAALAGIERWLIQALAALEPAARKTLLQEIGRELRRRNQRRIAGQVGPDGTPWAPRKRDRWGRIRKTARMLQGLRETRRLALSATPDGMVLGYAGRNNRLASVHHFGEVDRVEADGPQVKYAARELLGLSAEDVALVRARILAALA